MISQQIQVSGAVVSWSLSPTNRRRLGALYDQHGFGDELPPETSDRAALKGAMEDITGKDQIVQALKTPSKNGYEVVNVERDEKHNHYTNNFSAWLCGGQVTTGYGYTDTERLQERFVYRKPRVSGWRRTSSYSRPRRTLPSGTCSPTRPSVPIVAV